MPQSFPRIFRLAAMLVGFFLAGPVNANPPQTTDSGRQVLLLAPVERDAVLQEMRIFLQSVQGVIHGVRTDDLAGAAEAAKRSGMASRAAMPPGLVGKLPQEFATLGMDTHRRFDQLAMDAQQMGDGDVALEQLDRLLENCVACHAAFRIDPAPIERAR